MMVVALMMVATMSFAQKVSDSKSMSFDKLSRYLQLDANQIAEVSEINTYFENQLGQPLSAEALCNNARPEETRNALLCNLKLMKLSLIHILLLPLRKVFFEEKNGLMKLGVIILGLSLLSTIGPTMGSFEGYIYTKIPYMYQMLGYPEAILYVLLFIGILHVSIKYAHRRIITLLSILIMALICFLGIMSFVMA